MSVGSTSVDQTISVIGSTATTKSFDFSSVNPSGQPKISVECTENSIYIASITINYGGGASYSDYSLKCGTPCSNTPTMSFSSPTTVNKTTADASFTKAVTISGKGSGQTVAYSSSDETIATVNSSGVVTLKGKVGSTTITASVEASGTYCSASASYTLNVTAAPINVTLYYGGTSATLNNQTNPYTLPTTGAYVADMCDGDWTFDGWYGSTYAKSETKPDYITELTSTGSAYAVYKTTETTEGGGGTTDITLEPASVKSFPKDGITVSVTDGALANGSDYRVYKGQTMTITSTVGDITNIALTYSSASYDGGGWASTYTPNAASWTSPTASGEQARVTKIVVTVSGGGGTTTTTYYATTAECATPCTNTPSMSFANATVNKTTADGSFTQAVTITGKGDGQTVAYSSSDETVATVDATGKVTLKGKVGSATITASVAENGEYCAASATYTINVTQVVCALTGITLNTANVTTTFTNEDSFSYSGLVVTAAYSNCASKTITPTSVSTPDLTTAGTKTVTVTYTENGVTKTATYSITVTAVVYHTVTWKSCGETVKTEHVKDGAALVLPTAPGANAGKSFVGWTATQHHTGASAPADLFSTAGSKTVTADVTYYAVFR